MYSLSTGIADSRRFAGSPDMLQRGFTPRDSPQGLLPYRKHRTQPYIYTADEIVTVINAAKQLSGRIRPLTYSTILGLLSVTAMRSGEVVHLDRDDVDLRQGLITIGNAKFGKSRMVTCHQTTPKGLERIRCKARRVAALSSFLSFLFKRSGNANQSSHVTQYVREPVSRNWFAGRNRFAPTPSPRHSSYLRYSHFDAMVSR